MKNHKRMHQVALAAATLFSLPAMAFQLETPDPDIKVRLDLTPKYSLGYRLKDPSAAQTDVNLGFDSGVVNEDDGDRNFKKGLISNRLDLLGELDVSGPNWGLRLSGTAWNDQVYRGRNDNAGTQLIGGPPFPVSTVNNEPGQATNEFLPATRKQHGRDAELLDAFVTVKGEVGGMLANVRLGRHTLQWGESLFFGQNGIANAQGPVDVAKILSVPGWQFKEVLLPVEQASGTLRLAEGVQLGGYYQFKWRKSKIPGVGSYFSNQDYIGGANVDFGPAGKLPTMVSKDDTPPDSGQGGVQLRWSPTGGDYEYGFYAARYHDKTPSGLVFDFGRGNAHVAYAKNIRTFGASVTSSLGQLNWALEGSIRQNTPLNSDPAVIGGPSPIANCNNGPDTPCFAVGDTAHLLLSGIYVLQPSALWQGGAVLGELAYNHRLKIKKDIFAIGPGGSTVGLGGLDPNTTKGAFAVRVLFAPTYFQVMPGLDLTVPIGVGYNFGGRSSAIGNFAGGASKAGDLSIGLQATYQEWKVGLTYNTYFGKANTYTTPVNPPDASVRQLTFGQTLKDRSYIAFSASRTF